MVVGFDHEEVGSQSMVGADSKTLEYWLRSALYGVQAGSGVDDKVSLTRAVRTSDKNLIFVLTFFLTTRDNLQFAYPSKTGIPQRTGFSMLKTATSVYGVEMTI